MSGFPFLPPHSVVETVVLVKGDGESPRVWLGKGTSWPLKSAGHTLRTASPARAEVSAILRSVLQPEAIRLVLHRDQTQTLFEKGFLGVAISHMTHLYVFITLKNTSAAQPVPSPKQRCWPPPAS